MRRLIVGTMLVASVLLATPATVPAAGVQKLDFTYAGTECNNAYFNVTSSGIVHQWRDCPGLPAVAGGPTALHVVAKPYVPGSSKTPSGDIRGRLMAPFDWMLVADGDIYRDDDGNELSASLAQVYVVGQMYRVFVYRASDEAKGSFSEDPYTGTRTVDIWEGSPVRPMGGSVDFQDAYGAYSLDLVRVNIAGTGFQVIGLVRGDTYPWIAQGTAVRIVYDDLAKTWTSEIGTWDAGLFTITGGPWSGISLAEDVEIYLGS